MILCLVSIICFIIYIFIEKKAKEPITPLHLFKSSVFVISSIQFMFATLTLFVIMLYIPMYLQDIKHYSATKAGIFVIPMLLGLILSTAFSGQYIAKTGKYKIYPILGALITGISMFVLSLTSFNTSILLTTAALFCAGIGIGFLIQVALLAGQNDVEHKLLGVATGTLNFFKSLGGAFGSALFGAILTSSLLSVHTLTSKVSAFDKVFFWTIPFMIISFILAIFMKEKELSEEMIKVAEGEIEVPEY